MSFFWCLEHYLCLIKYYSFFLFFFAFQPSQLGNCWYFGPFWTIYLLNSSESIRCMQLFVLNDLSSSLVNEHGLSYPAELTKVFFLLKVFFRTKWKKNGDRCDWWQLKGTIKGHGGRRPMIPKSLICCSGAVQRMIWSWVLFRSGYPEISKFACSGFCLAFSKFQLPLPCSSSSKSWILDHLML